MMSTSEQRSAVSGGSISSAAKPVSLSIEALEGAAASERRKRRGRSKRSSLSSLTSLAATDLVQQTEGGYVTW